ncbi:MAG TPA: SIMPL domain-containing protein [Kofleriaceae bacterium]|nr:SIMPL domain-containing protein [Kofleriaceae bacterium]
MEQSIHHALGVNVFGSHLIRVDPDYATLDVAVTRLAPKPEPAFVEARRGAEAVRKALAERALPERDVRTSQITLAQEFEHVGGARKFAGYRARIDFRIVLEDVARTEQILIAVVEHGADVVQSVSFGTRQLRALRARAREAAFAAARAKAELYAAAAGIRLGTVVHVEDVAPQEAGRRGYASHAPDVDLAAEDDGAASGAYSPGAIVVSAAVMACFAIQPP